MSSLAEPGRDARCWQNSLTFLTLPSPRLTSLAPLSRRLSSTSYICVICLWQSCRGEPLCPPVAEGAPSGRQHLLPPWMQPLCQASRKKVAQLTSQGTAKRSRKTATEETAQIQRVAILPLPTWRRAGDTHTINITYSATFSPKEKFSLSLCHKILFLTMSDAVFPHCRSQHSQITICHSHPRGALSCSRCGNHDSLHWRRLRLQPPLLGRLIL